MEFIPDFMYGILEGSTEGKIDEYVKVEIEDAILNGTFEFLKKGNQIIGFYTYFDNNGEILINNMCVMKQFRDKNNLLPLRKYLRNKLKQYNKFRWKNRKSSKELLWEF